MEKEREIKAFEESYLGMIKKGAPLFIWSMQRDQVT